MDQILFLTLWNILVLLIYFYYFYFTSLKTNHRIPLSLIYFGLSFILPFQLILANINLNENQFLSQLYPLFIYCFINYSSLSSNLIYGIHCSYYSILISLSIENLFLICRLHF